MAPVVEAMALATPSLPCAPVPPGAVHDLPPVKVQPPAAVRYLVKLSVVPEDSERCTVAMASVGRVTPGLTAAIALSFQLVILPPKMDTSSCGVRISLLTPDRLYDRAIGPVTIGRSIASLPAQRLDFASANWAVLSAESEPPKSVWLAMKSLTPLPDPPPP